MHGAVDAGRAVPLCRSRAAMSKLQSHPEAEALVAPQPEAEVELQAEPDPVVVVAARELLHGGATFGAVISVLRCLPEPDTAEARRTFAVAVASVAGEAGSAKGTGLGWLRISGWITWRSCRRQRDENDAVASVETACWFWKELARPLLLEPGSGACFAEQLAVAAGLRGALGATQDLRAEMEAECLVGIDAALRPHGLTGSNVRRATGTCLLAIELARTGSHEFRRSALAGALALLTLPRRNDFEQTDCESALQHMGSANESAACKGGRHNDAPRWWHGDAGDEGPTAAVHVVVAGMLLPELLECRTVGRRCSAVKLWAALLPLIRPTVGNLACDGCADFAWAVLCRFHAVLLPARGKNSASVEFDARDDPLLWTLLESALKSNSKHTRARSFFVLRVALNDQDDSGWNAFMQLYDSLEHYPLQLLGTSTAPGLWKNGLSAVFTASSKMQSRLECKPRAADWTHVLCELGLCHPNVQVRRMIMESCLDGTTFCEESAISDHFILDSILPRITGSRASVSAARASRPVADLSDGEGPTTVPVVLAASNSLADFLNQQLTYRTGQARSLFFAEVLLHLQQLPESANAAGQLQIFNFLASISPDVGRGLLREESVKPLGHCVERLCRAQPDETSRSHIRRSAVMAVVATVSPPSTRALARLLACFPGQWIVDAGLDASTTLSNIGSSELQQKLAAMDCIDMVTGYHAKPSAETATEIGLVVGFISAAASSTGNMQPLNNALAPMAEALDRSEQLEYSMQLLTSVLAAQWCRSVTRVAFSTMICNSGRLCDSLVNRCWHIVSAGCANPLARDCLRFLHTVGRFCEIPALQTLGSRLAAHCLETRADSGSAILPILRVCVDAKLEAPIVSALLRYVIDLPMQICCGTSKELGAEYVLLRWECILRLSQHTELEASFWTLMLAYNVLEQVPIVLSALHDNSQQVICGSFELMQYLVSAVVAQNKESQSIEVQADGAVCHNGRLWEIMHNVFLMFRSIPQKSLALLEATTKLFLHPIFRDMVVKNHHSDGIVSWFDHFYVSLCELGQTNPRLMAIVAIQFVRLWLHNPDASTASHIIGLCCYSCESSSASGCTDLIQIDDAEHSADKMIPARIAFSASHSPAAVRGIAHYALLHVSQNFNFRHADWPCVGFKLLEELLEKLKSADSLYISTYNDDSDICLQYIALWQSLCLLVNILDCDSPTALVQELHDSAARSCLRPHALRVRQYIDCFLIQLLIAVPRLVPVWLPAALGDYSHQPQVASSLLVVAMNVLMLLTPSERQVHFKPLFWKINAWCGYSSRKNHLHSIAVVSTFRLLQAAEAAENDSTDVKECVDGWPRLSCDEQLRNLSMYAKTDPETVSDILKLNPVFDDFDLRHFCSHSCDQSVLVSKVSDNVAGDTCTIRGAPSFYDSIRSAFESVWTDPARVAGDGAQTSVKQVTQQQSSKHATNAWSGGASGDGIMYEQSLDDALQMVLPANSVRTDSSEAKLISRVHEQSTVVHVNDGSSISASISNQASTSIEHSGILEDHSSARPLPLLVCASDVQDARTAGALARVSEVLGSSGLCVREAAITKSGSFVATSVGAGMWLPTQTVAADALGAWLERQRAAGYAIVAVEPVSVAPEYGQRKSSPPCQSLVDYEFSARTVLVLGDAKLGHNASTLGLVDVVVHVDPSPMSSTRVTIGRGSLQPHISGAIAIWSYMRSQLVANGRSNFPKRPLHVPTA
eukprot:COSAG02_NODE_431_length_22447_cov_7.487202_8_plen_1717_part_00